MIDVISLYEDASRDDANKNENGTFSHAMFNRLLRRAENYLLKFLTGDLVPAPDFPMPYETQKNKDYLKNFIVRFPANNGFTIPADYFHWDNLYKIGSYQTTECDTEDVVNVEGCNTPIQILDGQAFHNRCNSYIKGLRPSQGKPIAKIVNNQVVINPADIGSVALEYIRYPKYGKIVSQRDTVYNRDIAAPAPISTNLEWDEWAREPLIWFMVNKFATKTSNKSLKEFNLADKPRG